MSIEQQINQALEQQIQQAKKRLSNTINFDSQIAVLNIEYNIAMFKVSQAIDINKNQQASEQIIFDLDVFCAGWYNLKINLN